MQTLKIVMGLLCASLMSIADFTQAEDKLASTKKTVLHQHPTLLNMLKRNNELRLARKLGVHRMNPLLTKAAQNHAWYMARTGQFSHFANGDPLKRATKVGYSGSLRENIALGQTSVKEAFQDWRNSSGHWQSIISKTTDAGFGYAISKSGQTYWVALYGTPNRTNAKSPPPMTKDQ